MTLIATRHFRLTNLILRAWVACLLFAAVSTASPARADELDSVVKRAEAAYRAGDYDAAALELSHAPGLLGVFPSLDGIRGSRRARLLFDLGRCYIAAGDGESAEAVYAYLHRIAPGQRRGAFGVPRDAAYEEAREEVVALETRTRQALIASRSRWSAALRSAVLPGWGQLYRGYRARGRYMIAATGGLALGWYFADRAYSNAVRAYQNTTIADLDLLARTGKASDPRPFDGSYGRVESRARIATFAASALAGLWVYSVSENLIVGPGRIGVVIPID